MSFVIRNGDYYSYSSLRAAFDALKNISYYFWNLFPYFANGDLFFAEMMWRKEAAHIFRRL